MGTFYGQYCGSALPRYVGKDDADLLIIEFNY
jgi:hypothetical protein